MNLTLESLIKVKILLGRESYTDERNYRKNGHVKWNTLGVWRTEMAQWVKRSTRGVWRVGISGYSGTHIASGGPGKLGRYIGRLMASGVPG